MSSKITTNDMKNNLSMQEVTKIVKPSTTNTYKQEDYEAIKEIKEPLSCWNDFIAGFLIGIVPSLIWIISTQVYGN